MLVPMAVWLLLRSKLNRAGPSAPHQTRPDKRAVDWSDRRGAGGEAGRAKREETDFTFISFSIVALPSHRQTVQR